jgi:hypothetical protein
MVDRKWLERWGPPIAGGLAIAVAGWLIAPSVLERQRIAALEPSTRRAYRQLIARLRARGISLYTGQTSRTPALQKRLVAEGKSTTEKSWHLARRAIDAYPIDPRTRKPDLKGVRLDLFRIMHEEAAKLGFRGLAFKTDGSKRIIQTSKGPIWDAGHIEYRGGFPNVAAAMAADRRAIAA